MVRVRKSPMQMELEELAKKIPAPFSWLIPDPNDPASYVHPLGAAPAAVGLTAKEGLKQILYPQIKRAFAKDPLTRFHWTLKPEDIYAMAAGWLRTVGEKSREALKEIKWETGLDVLGEYRFRPRTIAMSTPSKWHRQRRKPYMTFYHELSHHDVDLLTDAVQQDLPSHLIILPYSQRITPTEALTEWLARQRGEVVGRPVKFGVYENLPDIFNLPPYPVENPYDIVIEFINRRFISLR